MKKIARLCLLLLLLAVILPGRVRAEQLSATEISGMDIVKQRQNMPYPSWLFNGDQGGFQQMKPDTSVTLEHEQGIGSFYLIFDVSHEPYTVRNEDSGQEATCGTENFLHDFVDVKALFGTAPKSITISFGNQSVKLSEMRVFTEGEVPEDVQQWRLASQDGVDMLVLPTHGDDEQLFFAGLLPYYAGEKGYEVQVVYSTDHHNYNTVRPHEMLNGLWAVGVRNYPVFGPFPDYLTKSEKSALESIKSAGFEREDVLDFVVEQIRRFKPLVAVGHDLEGEYGHGFHKLYGRILKEAVEVSMNPEVSPESGEKYGVWDVPKTYIHLYPENAIHMNWDVPLSSFDGMTAYEVTKTLGYPAHKSQYSGFAWYFSGYDNAESIPKNGPCDYGLYRSTVGEDVEKNDLFENLVCREQMRKQEEEERLAREAEAEQLRREEEERRKEAQRKAAEEEADRKSIAEQNMEDAARREKLRMFFIAALAGTVSFTVLLVLIVRKITK